MWVGRANRKAASADVDRKIVAEHAAIQTKIDAERAATHEKISSERGITERKIESETELLQSKFSHEVGGKLVERAWADYSLRRDIYLDLAKQIDYLFDHEPSDDKMKDDRRKEFLRTTQKVRLIGSDEVVRALNSLTASITEHALPEVSTSRYGALMNAIRKDIRTLNEMPAVGTDLDSSAFPIES